MEMRLKSEVDGIGGLTALALGKTTTIWWTYTWASPIVDLFPGIKMDLSLGVTHDRFSLYILDDIELAVTFVPEKQEDWSSIGFLAHPGKKQVYGFSLFHQLNFNTRKLLWGGREYRDGQWSSTIIPSIEKQEKIKEKVREILGKNIKDIFDVNKLVYEALKRAHYDGNPDEKLNFHRYQKIALKRLKIH